MTNILTGLLLEPVFYVRIMPMNTDTRYIMALIKFTLITVACMLVYMSYNNAAATIVEAERPMPEKSPSVVSERCGELSSDTGVFPTGVMVQNIGGNASTYIVRDDHIVGLALDKQINGENVLPQVRVLQFCK